MDQDSGLSLKIVLSFLPLLALDEGDIEILKTYVSTSKWIDFYVKSNRMLYWLDMLCFVTVCIQEIYLGSVSGPFHLKNPRLNCYARYI